MRQKNHKRTRCKGNHEPENIEQRGKGLLGTFLSGIGDVYHVTGERGTGTLVALGADITMLADGVKGRVIVPQTGYGLSSVTLPASEIGPNRVYVFCLFHVTVLTAPSLVELDTPVGVCQSGTNAYRRCGRTVRENATGYSGYFYQRSHPARFDFVLLIEPGADLTIPIPSVG